jgi:glyoxylase-like metal-dependent hydrolase (beta-lactamase superfamily II)
MRLIDDVYLVSGGSFGLGHFADCNVYLVDCGNEVILIDSGAGIDVNRLADNVRADGFDVERITKIMNTHCHYDHTGGDRKIKDMSGCKIFIHENGAVPLERGDPLKTCAPRIIDFQGVHADRKLTDGERLLIGNRKFEILHTPGHCDDAICILMEHPAGKVLFSGDTAQAYGQPGVLSADSDFHAYVKSINRLAQLGIDVLLPGHGIFVLSGASEQIDHLKMKLSSSWCDFILYPPHPFTPRGMIERKLDHPQLR